VWCGVITLQGVISAGFLEHELPGQLEDVPLKAQVGIYFQPDEAPPYASRHATQSLNQHFPDYWIGLGDPQNWPPRSPDLNTIHFHVRGT
jgi:hypothetical protein